MFLTSQEILPCGVTLLHVHPPIWLIAHITRRRPFHKCQLPKMAAPLFLCFHSHSLMAFFLMPNSNKVGGPRLRSQGRRKQDKKRTEKEVLWHLSLAFESNSGREGKREERKEYEFLFLPSSCHFSPAFPPHFDENKISPFFSSPPPHLFFPGFYHEPPAMQMNCIMQIYANKA